MAEDFLNEPKAPLEETWEPLEPHEVVTIAKPIRKGRRKKQPVTKVTGVNVVKVNKTFTKSRGGPVKTSSIYNNSSTANQTVRVIVPVEEFLIAVSYHCVYISQNEQENMLKLILCISRLSLVR